MACCSRATAAFPTGLLIAVMSCSWASTPAASGADGPSLGLEEAKTKSRPVNFAREVRSILSDNCFACHGPDDKARKAGLRLDTKDGAFAKLKSGGVAIVPGKPDESELIFRLETDDPESEDAAQEVAASS